MKVYIQCDEQNLVFCLCSIFFYPSPRWLFCSFCLIFPRVSILWSLLLNSVTNWRIFSIGNKGYCAIFLRFRFSFSQRIFRKKIKYMKKLDSVGFILYCESYLIPTLINDLFLQWYSWKKREWILTCTMLGIPRQSSWPNFPPENLLWDEITTDWVWFVDLFYV